MQLQNPTLLRSKAYINGQWVNADNAQTFPIYNPYNNKHLGDIPNLGASETKRAINAANEALRDWRRKTAGERAQILKKWYELQMENLYDLAYILTVEQGKPLTEAIGEVKYGASFVEWFAEEARRAYGETIPGHGHDKRIIAIKQPIGVVAAITPWNFPNAMITRKVAPALAAGCTVVIKPSEETPYSALALAVLAEQAGMPPGVLNVVTTNQPARVGNELTQNPIVRKLSFTGSTPIGKLLMRQCADTIKKVSLELGGNAPFIVFDDADLEKAVAGAIACKYRNAGQTCVCANRIYVQKGIAPAFINRLTQEVEKLSVGSGLKEGTTIGPLINQKAVEKVVQLVNDATTKGAQTLTGGNPHSLGGTFFEPTVLTNVKESMDICHTEIFGPIATIFEFETEEEVIALANNTNYGLAAYFFSNDLTRVWRVSEALEYGMVGINTGMLSTPVAPFGGIKESGIGREGSRHGLDEYLEIKYMCIGGIE